MKPEELAQWVIDNRYPKGEYNKVSDFEMFHFIVSNVSIPIEPPVKPESTDIEKQEEIVTILYEFIDNMIKDYAYEDYKKGYSTYGIREAISTALEKILKLDNLKIMEV